LSKDQFVEALDLAPQAERVDHPSHYHADTIEAITVIEAWQLNFNRGNTLKYISRAGLKNPATEIEDLLKAQWYLNREIERLRRNAP
jgi:hypothetical protein